MIPSFLIFGLAVVAIVFLWPRFGLVSRWRRMRGLAARCLREDALKYVYKARVNGESPTVQSVAGTLNINSNRAAALLAEMEERALVTFSSGELQLTAAGRETALHIIRAHRLWERYLADRTGVAESQWHGQAEDREHHLSPEQTDALSAQLGHPTHDPHGDAIPPAGGLLAADHGQPLSTLPVNEAGLITHVEDEPESIYAQLAAEGLRPGMKVRILEKAPLTIRFWADGNEHVLAPMLANNIAVVPVTQEEIEEEPEFLSNLKPGQKARVLSLSPRCRGSERRRLFDLGFVPGSEVEVEMASPTGDPTAFRVRGTLIALRREQSSLIRAAVLEPVNA